MKIIAHRANTNGPNKDNENTLLSVNKAFDEGFDVELDVWMINDKLVLSHFFPNNLDDHDVATSELIKDERVWWHAKNLDALNYFLKFELNVFWHESDSFTLTKHGYIWTQLGDRLSENSIVVLPEVSLQKVPHWVAGVCTDFPGLYYKSFN